MRREREIVIICICKSLVCLHADDARRFKADRMDIIEVQRSVI